MGLVFRPAILKAGTFHALPQPITKVQIQESWDFERYKVLLEDGDGTVGRSRNGVDITLHGEVARVGDQLLLSEVEMLAALEDLRAVFHADGDASFSVYLYRDEGDESSRYFQECSVTRFVYDLTRPELYVYSLVLHADDPVLRGGG
ncbi:hypothetical protein [Rubinisphaera margarita]|uniref:hypothetical protein n=1 Tax=Rubinisphaera margarita TaxID=2909586 RepID=UPI001EE7A3BB|nr:hypothetical protein [Rubinisphaera margarita]MCG6154902.1 hypothetical protein [Rubinisphaera margarita]